MAVKRHLVRMTMRWLEGQLPQATFARIHWSAIVNEERVRAAWRRRISSDVGERRATGVESDIPRRRARHAAATSDVKSPRPSPNGEWLAYLSDESGTAEVYVRTTEASRSERWQVSTGGGRLPRWARDGGELLFLTRDSLMAADVSRGIHFGVGARRSLFSIARFNGDTYDVLPGDAGFLILQTESDTARKSEIVFVDRGTTLPAAAKRAPVIECARLRRPVIQLLADKSRWHYARSS